MKLNIYLKPFIICVWGLLYSQCSKEEVVSINLDKAVEKNDPAIYREFREAMLPPDTYVSENYILAYHDEGGRLCLYGKDGNYLRQINQLGNYDLE